MSLLGFVLTSMYPEEDRSYLSSGYSYGVTLQSAAEATVDIHCKTVCFNQLFGDVNIFSIVSSKKDNFFNVSQFLYLGNSLRKMVLPWGASTGLRIGMRLPVRIYVWARPKDVCVCVYADDTTVVGLITDNHETAHREEFRDLAVWCQDKNLSLNVSKTNIWADHGLQEKEGPTGPH